MKRILLISAITLINLGLFAQTALTDEEVTNQLDSVVTTSYNNPTTYRTQVIEYTSNGYNQYSGLQGWTKDSALLSSKYVFEFDEKKNMTLYEYYNWSNNTWVEGWRNKYLLTYSGNNLTEKIEQRYQNNSWTDKYRTSYNYDNSNNLTSQIYQTATYNNTGWSNVFGNKTEWTYDGNNKVKQYLYFTGHGSVNTPDGTWNYKTLKEYTYNRTIANQNDYNDYIVTYNWLSNSSKWDTTGYEIIYLTPATVNTNEHEVSSFYYYCPDVDVKNQNNCTPSDKVIFGWNWLTDKLIESETSRWNGNSYTFFSKIAYGYDIHSGPGAKKTIEENYDYDNGWFLTSKKRYYYKQTPTGLNNNDKEISNQITLIPNPVTKNSSIKLFGLNDGTLTILTLDGTVIKQEKTSRNNPVEINAINLTAGLYLVRYTGENGESAVKKFIVQ